MHEIYHHGVKGMKWGVRRYQNPDGSLTPAGREHYGYGSGNKKGENTTAKSKSSSKNVNDLVKSNAKTKVSDLTGMDPVLLYSATYAIGITALAVYAKHYEKKMRKKKENELEELNKNKEIKSFEDAPKLSKKMSPEESVKLTNPDFPDLGTTMNCTFCTTAMVLREKGYDVKASKLSDGWYSDNLFEKTFNSPEVKMKGIKNKKENVIKELSSHGDGAYGNLVVTWKYGGSHSIFWKNENGTTNFYDGQSGKSYTKYADKNMLLGEAALNYTSYNRLDNCQPTEYALAVVESAKKSSKK